MQEFLDAPWFELFGLRFTYGGVLSLLALFVLITILYWWLIRRYLPRHFDRVSETRRQAVKTTRMTTWLYGVAIVLMAMTVLRLDYIVYESVRFSLTISTILKALFILQLARLFDLTLGRVFIRRYYAKRDEPSSPAVIKAQPTETAGRTVQFTVYLIALVLILRAFDIDYILFHSTSGDFDLNISNLLMAFIILLIARLVIWAVTQVVMYGYYRQTHVDEGSQYAFNQLIKYVVYVIAIMVAVTQLGVKPTLVFGGLAALLVGIGLGLQHTFNDFFSGIILLFERSVQLGDVLEVDGLIGFVSKIGVRASIIQTRDNVSVVVPNSKLTTHNVINWSHNDDKVRFHLHVGVAYGSDTSVVQEILLRVASRHHEVLSAPPPFIRLTEFAEYRLTFELHFWSREFITIENVKSDLRLMIDEEFTKHGIQIPVPQHDLWVRTPVEVATH